MNKTSLAIVFVLGCLGMAYSNASAAPFEPAFKLNKITGECNVMTPGTTAFSPAVEGKAYAYGSKIQTGIKSTAVVEFSPNNTCRVLASTVLTVTEESKDKKAKILKLDEGRIGVELEEKFHENNSLNVETAAAICGAIGCKFTVNSSSESDLRVVVIVCEDGKLKVVGSDFDIPLLKKDDGVSISKAKEKDFIRIKNIRGLFNVNLKNSKGEPISPELKSGYSVKIYREESPNGKSMLVYLLILTPEGKTESTYAYSRPLDGKTEGGEVKDGDAKNEKKEKKKKDDVIGDKDAIEPIGRTTTTTVATTTTTLPPGDLQKLKSGAASVTHTVVTPSVGGPASSGGGTSPTPTPVGNR